LISTKMEVMGLVSYGSNWDSRSTMVRVRFSPPLNPPLFEKGVWAVCHLID
jgi:hypothetical protein